MELIVCVCVCVCARARARVYVCVIYILRPHSWAWCNFVITLREIVP